MAYLSHLHLGIPLNPHATEDGGVRTRRIDARPRAKAPIKASAEPIVESSVVSASLFTDIERLAVRLGIHDPLPGSGAHRYLVRIGSWLFGTRGPQPLADQRLEALRLLAMSLRRRPSDATRAIENAGTAGIPAVQIQALLASQAGNRAPGAAHG